MSLRILAKDHQVACFNEDDKKWKSSFFFIQGADLQMGMIESYIEKKTNPGWEKEIKLGKQAIAKVNQMRPKPKFFVICGDLCDAFPDIQPEIRKRQEQDFKNMFNELDPEIPLICLSGNHDIGNCPTEETIDMYINSFGDDYFSFWCGGICFIVINTQFFTDPSKVPKLAKKHEEWLNEQLKKVKEVGARSIVFQHIPWFVQEPDEEANYFSIEPNIRKVWLEKFSEAGVVHVFAGHYHRNAGGIYKQMPVTVTTALGAQLGTDQPGLRVVQVLDTKVQHTFYTLDKVPVNVTL